MDILDIDEALKDDSFIFLEDKTHDDISNILQQWKSNNCVPSSTTSSTQQPQLQENIGKIDTRTFTRPKRKSTQSLEPQFIHVGSNQQQQQNGRTTFENPMLNLEIGGLVTTMDKSCLQNTSPPSFLHSMDDSVNVMNSSLITSADFTNTSFLQSPSNLREIELQQQQHNYLNVLRNVNVLGDVMRDRKTLESLTMSSDGTLIKDSHIGQIDDLSLALSKTTSSCSTMENSTESDDGANRTVIVFNPNHTFIDHVNKGEGENDGKGIPLILATAAENNRLLINKTDNNSHPLVLTDEHMHCNLQESDIGTNMAANITHVIPDTSGHGLINKTVNLTPQSEICDYTQNITPDKCETPELVDVRTKFYESTPQASSIRCYNKQPYTSRLHTIEDTNISPITALSPIIPQQKQQQLNKSYEHNYEVKNSTYIFSNNETYLENRSNHQLHQTDDIKRNSNENFNQTYQQHYNTQTLGMQNVMNLAEAEANLLATNNNEEEFDHMLDEFGRIELNSEQLKMKKSLDSLKKRFNYQSNATVMVNKRLTNQPLDVDDEMIMKDNRNELKNSNEQILELSEPLTSTNYEQDLHKDPNSTYSSNSTDSKTSGLTGSSLSTCTNNSCSGERLLTRRSRLYDDINLSTVSTMAAMPYNLRSPGSSTSFTIKKENILNDKSSSTAMHENLDKFENEHTNIAVEAPIQQKFINKFQHDQDRFKTITITKIQTPDPVEQNIILANEFHVPRVDECNIIDNESNSIVGDLTENHERDRYKTVKIKNKRCMESKPKVPCIDSNDDNNKKTVTNDNEQTCLSTTRCSRRDQNTPANQFGACAKDKPDVDVASNNNKTLNAKYLTYKKNTKEIQTKNVMNTKTNTTNLENGRQTRIESRTLSRPRFISGLTKLSLVNKATSADELEKTLTNAQNNKHINLKEKKDVIVNMVSNNLKSPMGIKSKSFHNLSTNSTVMPQPLNSGIGTGCKTFGLPKPSSISSNLLKHRNSVLSTTQQQKQKSDDPVFKVPKQVSGIRVPGGTSNLSKPSGTSIVKRAGIVRPSSCYYNINVMVKGSAQPQPTASDSEFDSGRHSPTDSLSSASSKGSGQSLNTTFSSKPSLATKSVTTKINSVATNLNLQKVTISSSGIPKPSGLRPPSNIKRSGLPRPASFVKTDK